MSEQLLGRAVRVHVINDVRGEAVIIENLRVQLKVKKSLQKEPNTCELCIFNLNPESRANMQKKGAKIIVEAGYQNTISQIFSGDARTIDHIHDGPNWVTKIQCGDGERAYQFHRVSNSFRPGTAWADVAKHVIGQLEIDPGQSLNLTSAVKEQFTQGYSAHGRASNELDRLLTGRGLEWSIQDGRLQVLPTGKPSSRAAVFLSADTGLVGSPEHGTPEKKGKPAMLKVKSLLQPTIQPGGKIQIRSESIDNGLFRVEKVTHTGDTFGGNWYSEAECLPL